MLDTDDIQWLCWSNAVAADASAENASERLTKVVIEDSVDEGVGSECQQCNPRRYQQHQLSELHSCQAKQASQEVGKEERDEAD